MEVVLKHADIQNARAVCILVSDSKSAHRIVQAARRRNPNCYIIARVHYVSECEELYTIGANDVVSDEFGSSIEIFTKVLLDQEIPLEEIERIAAHFRQRGLEQICQYFNLNMYNIYYVCYSLVLFFSDFKV